MKRVLLFLFVYLLVSQIGHAEPINKLAILTAETSQKLRFSTNENEIHAQNEAKVHVIEQPLADFLRQAARRNGYEITLSKRVRGVIKNRQMPADIHEILSSIAEQYDLKWHFQKSQLYVSVGDENTNRLIYLGQMEFDKLKAAMSQAGIKSDEYEISYVDESNSVLVNGSPSYIASIELLVDSFSKENKNKKSGIKIIKYGKVGKQEE